MSGCWSGSQNIRCTVNDNPPSILPVVKRVEVKLIRSDGIVDKPKSLEHDFIKHRPAEAIVKLADLGAEVRLNSYVCVRPRAAHATAFWSTHSIFNILGIECWNKQASKWSNMSWKSWDSFFAEKSWTRAGRLIFCDFDCFNQGGDLAVLAALFA